MNFQSVARCIVLFTFLAAFAQGVSAEVAEVKVLGVGDKMEAFTLKDQNGNEHLLDSSVSVILFSRDRAGAGVMTRSMEGRDGDFLAERGVVYVNDISAMPRAAAALFAVPKMRTRPYPILLDRKADLTAQFPDKAKFATLVHFDSLEVTEVEYVREDTALAERLEALPKKD